jgi:8-amino-3,8-dideoxy-alpha-D-manno-octulosonate transaminase
MKSNQIVDHGVPLAIDGGEPARKEPLPLEFPGAQRMDDEEIQAVVRVLKAKSPFRYYGIDPQAEVDHFEEEFARFAGVRHALAVSSGTGALHVSLAALGVGPGQEVIVPAYLWVSVIAAVVNQGAIPVLADIDSTFGLNARSVEAHITPKTSGIIVTHMSGAPSNVEPLQKLARERGLFLLEDCAQCAGGSIEGRKVGSFGDMGIYSFQLNKNMTAGEGGCVVTNNPDLYRRAFACHDLGYVRDEGGRLIFDRPDLCLWGKGYRMDEIRAAVLRVQLRKLPASVAAMRASKYRIRQALEAFPGVQLRTVIDPQGDTGCFLITTYASREIAVNVQGALRAEGLTTWPQGISNVLMTDWGLHLYSNNTSLLARASVDRGGFPWNLPVNAGAQRYEAGSCPQADSLFHRSILLPIPSCLTTHDEDDIICAFQKVLPVMLRTGPAVGASDIQTQMPENVR